MPDAPTSPATSPVSRRAFLGAAAAGGVTLALSGGIGARHENTLELVRSSRPVAGAPTPIRVALLTDLHAPHHWPAFDEVAGAVRDFDPHLVLIVGDSIEQRREEAQVRAYDALSARHGKFATLGNHEYWSGCDLARLRREYERAGVRLLVNAETTVEIDGRPIHLAGLDDWRAGAPDYRLVADARPGWRDAAHRVVLTHCPVAFDLVRRASSLPFDAFAGHTHAGQIAPFGNAIVLPNGSGGYVKGWYAGPTAPQRLYVSRGLGNTGVPFRIGARPELSLITLGGSSAA